MNEKVFKGSFTETPPSRTTLFPPSPEPKTSHDFKNAKVVQTVYIVYALGDSNSLSSPFVINKVQKV